MFFLCFLFLDTLNQKYKNKSMIEILFHDNHAYDDDDVNDDIDDNVDNDDDDDIEDYDDDG